MCVCVYYHIALDSSTLPLLNTVCLLSLFFRFPGSCLALVFLFLMVIDSSSNNNNNRRGGVGDEERGGERKRWRMAGVREHAVNCIQHQLFSFLLLCTNKISGREDDTQRHTHRVREKLWKLDREELAVC